MVRCEILKEELFIEVEKRREKERRLLDENQVS